MKGQTAMEYLMTYGWAIIIVIIVAAALYTFGFFSPATYVTKGTSGFSNLGKPQDWSFGTDGILKIKMRNMVGSTITVYDVNASDAGGNLCNSAVNDVNSPSLPANLATGSVTEFQMNCTDIASAAGSTFSFTVNVLYAPTGGYNASDTGTVTGSVV